MEPFIWTFGDSNSILLSSLLLLLLFADLPYLSAGTPFYLMRMKRRTWVLGQLLYTAVRLFFRLWTGLTAGIVSVFAFTVVGFLLNPENLKNLFHLPAELAYKARVWVGWLSPLNQATYHMHNFGYDLLPRLWQTYLLFSGLLLMLLICNLLAVRHYNFHFRGTEVL